MTTADTALHKTLGVSAADKSLPPLRWPTPPYIGYGNPAPATTAVPCEVEGFNAQSRQCLLVSLEPERRIAHIQVPPSRTVMPLRFDMFRRLTLTEPLAPLPPTDATGQDASLPDLLGFRPRLPYRLTLKDGTVRQGETIGQVESEAGLFLFEPLDGDGRVRRLFFPRDAYTDVHVGEAIGQVLVEEHMLTPQQVEQVAHDQEALRQRKLGDYLVGREIVQSEQLVSALEEQRRMPLVRIGEALTALGLISEAQLQEALTRQKQERSVPLGEMLVQSGLITREKLRVALARKMGYPIVDLKSFTIDLEALRRIPPAVAKRLRIVPLLRHANTLIVAAEDPSQHAMIDELEFLTQGKVVAALANVPLDAQSIGATYARYGFDEQGQRSADAAQGITSGELLESLEQDAATSDEDAAGIEQSDNSLVRLINNIIIEAYQQGASDIHIETHPSKRKVRIRLRKDGRLHPHMELPHTYRAALVARIKIMCELDISERRKPQDGKIDFGKFSPQHRLELRVSTIPTYGGAEDVVLRILTAAKPVPVQDLGLTAENLSHLLEIVRRPHGMVLCVGPTGSGKTTTLHSLLQHINTPDRKIWTAEDPIEITNPDLRQIQVNAKIDWTFDKALRALLRADPDVIMVGEIRDAETAQVAIEASLTGHLVLSTLHTNSAAETVIRLLDMGMDPFNFADSLVGVLAQRLVRRLCPACLQYEDAPDDWVEELLVDYGRAFPADLRPPLADLKAQWIADYGSEGRLVRAHASGCPTCDQSGYKSRLGIHELLTVDPPLRRLIQTKAPPEVLEHSVMATGHFRTLRQDGILKVLLGLTSIDEIRASTAH